MNRSTFSWTLPPGPPLTAEQRRLVTEALFLVPAVVRRVIQVRPEAQRHEDDLASVARESLLWAAQRFVPGRGKWLSYAFWGARMRCLAWLKASKLRDPDVYLDAPVFGDDPDSPTAVSCVPDSGPSPDHMLLVRQVLNAVSRLPDRERVAIEGLLNEMSLKERGATVGRTYEMVRKWETSGLELLRAEFGLGGRRPHRERKQRPALDARERMDTALREGPKSVAELRELTGYTRMGVRTRLDAIGAIQVDVVTRNNRKVPLWVLPSKAA